MPGAVPTAYGAIVALPTCPKCGGDDLARVGTEATGAMTLRCKACGEIWSRDPKIVGSGCGSEEIEVGGYEGWAYDDIEEARDDPGGGSWAYINRKVFRCRNCNHRWRRSGEPRPYQR